MTEPITVLVTAVGGGGHGEQILKALRLAGSGRYRIIGADMNPFCPQFAAVDEAVTLPRADSPDFVDAVLAVCRRFEARAVFHGCEPELKVYSRNRDRFARAGVLLPINPAEVIEVCMDKARTSAFLRDQGFDPPRFASVGAASDLDGIDWFPVVVKPSLGGGGSANCFIAQTPRQLRALADYLDLGAGGPPFIVQEYVGAPDSEFTVGVLHDLDGAFVNSIAVRRVLQGGLGVRLAVRNITGRRDLGEALVISSGVSQGHVGRFPDVTGPCERIAAALGARGAVNIQCRLVDGRIKVFEINPRFSGTTSLRAMMGYNEPDLLLRRHLGGESLTVRFPYREGAILRSLVETPAPDRPAPAWGRERG